MRTRTHQAGQTMTEYVLIVSLVAIALLAAVTLFGNDVKALFFGSSAELRGGRVGLLSDPGEQAGGGGASGAVGGDASAAGTAPADAVALRTVHPTYATLRGQAGQFSVGDRVMIYAPDGSPVGEMVVTQAISQYGTYGHGQFTFSTPDGNALDLPDDFTGGGYTVAPIE